MRDDLTTDKHLELRARVVVCREYSRALEEFLMDSNRETKVIDYASRIVDHQAAIEQLIDDIVLHETSALTYR